MLDGRIGQLVLIDGLETAPDAVKERLLAQCLHARLGLLAPTSLEVTVSTVDAIPKADLSWVLQAVEDCFKGVSAPSCLALWKEALKEARAKQKKDLISKQHQ